MFKKYRVKLDKTGFYVVQKRKGLFGLWVNIVYEVHFYDALKAGLLIQGRWGREVYF